MRGSVKRGLIGLLATVLVLAGIIVVGWQVFGLGYLEAQIRKTLAEQGFPARELTLRAAGIDGAELVGLDIDYAGGVTVETIEAEYRLSELVSSGRIDRLTVSGLRLDLTRLPAPAEEADTGEGRDDGSSSFALPVDEIVVRDSHIAVGGPLGAIAVALDMEARSPAGGGMTISGAMTLRGESGEIATPFAADIAPNGAVEMTATPEAGRLEWRGAAFELSAGSLAAAGGLAGLDRLDGLLYGRISLPDGTTASFDAGVGLEDDVLTVQAATIDSAREGIELTAAVQGLSGSMTGFDAELVGDLRPLSQIAALTGLAAGQVVEDGWLTVRLSGHVDRPLGGLPQTADGRILVLGQGTLASGERGEIDMAAQFEAADGAVRLTGERPLKLGWRPSNGTDALAATLGDGGDKAFEMRVGQAGAGWTMALAGPFTLNHGLDGAVGEIDLTTSLDWSGPDDLVGPVKLELGLSGLLEEIGTLVDGRVELAGDLGIRQNRWRFRPHDCVVLGVRRLSILSTDTRIDELAGCLEASTDGPMLAVSAGGRGGLRVSAILRAEPAIVILDAGSSQPSRLDVELPSAVFDLGTGTEDEISVSGAGVTLHDPGIAFEDIAFVVDSPPDSVPGIRLDGVTVRSLQSPEWFAPVSVIGEASLTGEGALVFQGSVRGGSGALAAAVNGDHDTLSGQGWLEVRLDPVSFAPGIRQPADLAPILAEVPVSDVTGSVDGIARLGWGDRLTSSGELELEDLTLSLGGAIIRSIGGRIRADSLLPFSLPDGQLLALGGADFGLTLEEGALAFGLSDGDLLSVQGLGFGLAGGSLAVEPFQARLADQEVMLAVTLQGVDLNRLSQQFPAEGLSITGRIDGRIPLRLMGDTITVDNGVLESTEAGVIRYVAAVPVGPPEEGGVALLITAVENFQYEALRATLDGRTGEDLDVAIRLTGANPELYDGFPIALNVNLSGALDQILLSGLRPLTIADEAGRVLRGE